MPRTLSPAMRRYLTRLAVLMTIYVACIFLAGYLFRHNPPNGLAAYALAVLPALPIIGVVWSIMRLIIEETDEYLRMLHVKQNLFATGFCLTVMTVWEFLQNYDLVSHDSHGFGTTFVWFMGLGIGAIYLRLVQDEGSCA
ncbi:MAG TPA: hypothetical protein VHG29_03645 [Novosphingobium sp.]|nr:hypothetical protein [Novosphingobium sp.]